MSFDKTFTCSTQFGRNNGETLSVFADSASALWVRTDSQLRPCTVVKIAPEDEATLLELLQSRAPAKPFTFLEPIILDGSKYALVFQEHRFKAGDKVVYTKVQSFDIGLLILGKVYEVRERLDGLPAIEFSWGPLGGDPGSWTIEGDYANSFELYVEPVVEAPKFAVGDWVECADNHGATSLTLGKLYNVVGHWDRLHPKIAVDDAGYFNAGYLEDRFKPYVHPFSDADYAQAQEDNSDYEWYSALMREITGF